MSIQITHKGQHLLKHKSQDISYNANGVTNVRQALDYLYFDNKPVFSITDPAVNEAVSIAVVDAYSGVLITTTEIANAQTIQDPTVTTRYKRFLVANSSASTDPITINGVVLIPGQALLFFWDGTDWIEIPLADAADVAFTPTTEILSTNVQDAIEEVAGMVSGSSWGAITGILSDQTDLQNALDDKANLDGSNTPFTGQIRFETNNPTSILSDTAFPYAVKFQDNTAFTGINIPVSASSENTRSTIFGLNRLGVTNNNALDYVALKLLLSETITLNPDGNPSHATTTTDVSTLDLPTNYYIQITGTSNGKDGVYISPTMTGTTLTIATLVGGNPGFINETVTARFLAQEVFLGSLQGIGLYSKLALYGGQTNTSAVQQITNLGVAGTKDINGTASKWYTTNDGEIRAIKGFGDGVATWSTITSPLSGSALQGFAYISATSFTLPDSSAYIYNGTFTGNRANLNTVQIIPRSSYVDFGQGFYYFDSDDDEFKFNEGGGSTADNWKTLQWIRDSVNNEISPKNDGDAIRLTRQGAGSGDFILEEDGWSSTARLTKYVAGEYRGFAVTNEVNLTVGNAFQFDGATTLDFGNSTDFNLYDNTIVFRVKTSGNTMIIASAKSTSSDGYYFYITPAGKMNFYAQSGAAIADLVSTTTINDNYWHMITLIKVDGSFNLYIDDNTTPEASAADFPVTITQPFMLGSWASGTLSYTGAIDEFYFYARAWETDEITYYYSKMAVDEVSLLLGLHFENNILDFSHYGKIATLTGTADYISGAIIDSATVTVTMMESYEDTTLGSEGRINYGNRASNVHFRGYTITMDGSILATDKIMLVQTDGNEYISSLNDGYVDVGATTAVRLLNDTSIGDGVSGKDFKLTFIGSNNLGVITWMDDEDYFQFGDTIHFGDTINYTNWLNSDGKITWGGTHKKLYTIRPHLIDRQTRFNDNKPTEVYRGCNTGYSFPIYNSDDEELFFRFRVPENWDGTTDPQFGIVCTITGAEDIGDKFKFQLDWQTTTCGGATVMGTTTSNCVSEQTIITGGTSAYTAYCVFFTLNADDATNPIVAGRMIQGRLRRIAASSNEVANEVAVWDWVSRWALGCVYDNWSVESNVS